MFALYLYGTRTNTEPACLATAPRTSRGSRRAPRKGGGGGSISAMERSGAPPTPLPRWKLVTVRAGVYTSGLEALNPFTSYWVGPWDKGYHVSYIIHDHHTVLGITRRARPSVDRA